MRPATVGCVAASRGLYVKSVHLFDANTDVTAESATVKGLVAETAGADHTFLKR